MFDISWGELLILGIASLIFVGPKELPKFLGMLSRYAGVVRRHAQDFRQQLDEAVRAAELAEIAEEVENIGNSTHVSLGDVVRDGVTPSTEAIDAPSTSRADQAVPEPATTDKPES